MNTASIRRSVLLGALLSLCSHSATVLSRDALGDLAPLTSSVKPTLIMGRQQLFTRTTVNRAVWLIDDTYKRLTTDTIMLPAKAAESDLADMKCPQSNDRGIELVIDANRIDWLVQKPGEYVTAPFSLKFSCSLPINISFREFGELTSKGGGKQAVPVYYKVGETLSGNSSMEWHSAESLNSITLRREGQCGGTASDLTIWQLISISEELCPGLYDDTSILTISLCPVEPACCP